MKVFMGKFLLLTIPFLRSNVKFYPVSYVASIIKGAGWDCDYIDLNRETFYKSPKSVRSLWDTNIGKIHKEVLSGAKDTFTEILSGVGLNQYTMVGVSLYPSCQSFTKPFLLALRELNYTGVTNFGGPDCFPTNHGHHYFDGDVYPDFIFQGESEVVLPLFLKEFEKNQDYRTELPGFMYKADDGTIKDTGKPTSPKASDFDIVADHSIYGPGYAPLLSTFTSRGCINKCSFCSEWGNFNPLRQRNSVTVAKELALQKKYIDNPKDFWLLDSNFNTSRRHVVDFCNALIDEKVNLSWKTMGCFRIDLDIEVLELMKKSGFAEMMIGFESASQVVLDYMGKNYDSNYAQEVIARFNRVGIDVRLPVMNGFPGECTSDFLTTCAFILRYADAARVHFSYSNICVVFDNTRTYDYPADFCLQEVKLFGQDWMQCDGMNIIEVRQVRRAFAMHLIKKAVSKNFDANSLLETIDFNIPEVAVELAGIIHYLAVANGQVEEASGFINDISDRAKSLRDSLDDCGRLDFLSSRIPGLPLSSWLLADKQGKIRQEILDYIYLAFERLGKSIDKTVFIDCKRFKLSLYDEMGKHIDDSEVQCDVESVRLTEYDKGQFYIVEGKAWDHRTDNPVSMVLANVGSNVIEFHYGLPSSDRHVVENLSCLAGFWGKVKKSYLGGKSEVVLTIVCNDGHYIKKQLPLTVKN